MSSRFTYDDHWTYEEDANLIMGRYLGRRKKALMGRPGLTALQDLEAALTAMPHKRLIAGSLCDGKTGMCAMGAWLYRHWVDRDGLTPREAWKRLQSENKRAASEWDYGYFEWDETDELDRTIDVGIRELDITRTLAEVVAEMNDERCAHITPEERHKRALQWVRDRIAGLPEMY